MIILILILILLILAIYWRYEKFQATKKHIKLIGRANTPESRERGLMFRDEPLPPNSGLLFDYNGRPSRGTFWMKNTYIPLDVIFLDQNYKVVGLLKDMKPFSLNMRGIDHQYYYAIEINAGEMDINIGDEIKLSN